MAKQNKVDMLAGLLAVFIMNEDGNKDFHLIAKRAYELAEHTLSCSCKDNEVSYSLELSEKIILLCKKEKSLPEIKRKLSSRKLSGDTVEKKVKELEESSMLSTRIHVSGYGRPTKKYTAA